MSFSCVKQYLAVSLRVTVFSAISLLCMLLIIDMAHAQPGGRGDWGRDGGMGGPPQRGEMRMGESRRAEPRMGEPQQMRTESRRDDGNVVVTTTSGDDVAVEVTAAPQGGFQPGQVPPGGPEGGPNGPPGPGGFQPGQAPPGGPGTPPGGITRDRRLTVNEANPDIRKEDFNATGENRKLRIMFQKAPWRMVLEWFANEAGLSLELESAPPGSFSYRDETGATYSIDETFNLINSYLLRRNFLMVRTGKLLMLVNLSEGLPAELIRDVPLEKLDDVGDYEVVRVLFNLTGTTPEVVQAEIQQFVTTGSVGQVTALSKSQQVYVTAFGDRLRTVREIIKGIDSPEASTAIEPVTLKNIDVDAAVKQLKLLLPLADNDPTLRAMIGSNGSSIWLAGRRDRVASAKHMLQTMDVPTDTSGVSFKVYPVPSASATVVLSVIQTRLAGNPNVRASLDTTIGAIAFQGRPEDHQKVEEIIDELERAAFITEVLQLSRMSTTAAKELIDNYFSPTTSSSSSQQPRNPFMPGGGTSSTSTANTVAAPIVTTNISAKQLVIRGTRSQIEQIKDLLTKSGEPNLRANATYVGNQERMRVIPMSEKQGQIILQLAQPMWSQMGNQPLNVTSPGQLIAPTPGARTQPIQFNQQQPYQPLRPQGSFGQPGRPGQGQFGAAPDVRQLQDISSQLPEDYLRDVPNHRIHVIDGMAGENDAQNAPQQMQPPRPERQGLPEQGQPEQNVPYSGDTVPATNDAVLPTSRSEIDLRLDDLFGPMTETLPKLPATQPGYMPSSTPQNVPTEDRLTTRTVGNGQYVAVAYRQEEPVAEQPSEEKETPAAEVATEPAETVATPQAEANDVVASEATPETTAAETTSENQSGLFGIVANPISVNGDTVPATTSKLTEVQTQLFSVENEADREQRFAQERGSQRDFNGRSDGRFVPRDGRRPERRFDEVNAGAPAQSLDANAGHVEQGNISISLGSAGLVIVGDPDALNEFEEMIQSLNVPSILNSQSTEFYLIKNAKADTIKTMLTSILGSSSSSSTSSDPLAGIPNDPMDALMGNMFGGSKIQATGPYEILVDARSNTLIINANRVDHLTILELLPILDRLGRSDDVMINAKPHLIPLQYVKAETAETAVRTIFAENLQGAGGNNQGGGNRQQQGGGRGNQPGGGGPAAMMMGGPAMMMGGGPGGMGGGGPQEFMQMMARMRGGNQQQNQQIAQVEVQTMTLAVETTTNSLIVYSPEELFLQVETFVKELDRLSQNQEETSTIVPIKEMAPGVYSKMLTAMLGNDAVTVTNNATNRGTSNRGGGMGGGGFGGGMMGGGNRTGAGGGMMGGGFGGGATGANRGGMTGGRGGGIGGR